MQGLARPPALRRAATALLDLLLPPRCLICGATVSEAGALCAPCWSGITFLGEPCCACCGLPFEFALTMPALCGACARAHPAFDRARAAMRYDEASRDLILAFKHGDRLHLAPAFGAWLRRAGGELVAAADIAVPVPLHWTRLFTRRYNQAAVLAYALQAAGGPPVGADWLVRRRRTPSQGKRNAAARERNVRAAFALKPGRDVRGKRVLLIDDVFTTGATVGECARVLRRGGAAAVDVLTVARTVRQEG
ncbi:MAG TPA: ComF family protein [Stellaceae bacterium]|nr:ComF family protein [Stellaceae bacterium]